MDQLGSLNAWSQIRQIGGANPNSQLCFFEHADQLKTAQAMQTTNTHKWATKQSSDEEPRQTLISSLKSFYQPAIAFEELLLTEMFHSSLSLTESHLTISLANLAFVQNLLLQNPLEPMDPVAILLAELDAKPLNFPSQTRRLKVNLEIKHRLLAHSC